jgi:hypothetical protein
MKPGIHSGTSPKGIAIHPVFKCHLLTSVFRSIGGRGCLRMRTPNTRNEEKWM